MKRLIIFAFVAVIPLACSGREQESQTERVVESKSEMKQSISSMVWQASPTNGNPAEAKAGETKSEWTQLFNGRDTTGWKPHPKEPGKWVVRDGILISYGSQLSHLFTERDDYENVHLRVEAKISEKGNSGQFARAKFGSGTLKGYEANISAGSSDGARTGTLTNLFNIKEKLHEPNVWITQELIVIGNHIRILVNDRQVVDHTDTKKLYSKGHIAIQHRPGGGGGGGKGKKGFGGGVIDDEDWTVMFKKIEVKELSPAGR